MAMAKFYATKALFSLGLYIWSNVNPVQNPLIYDTMLHKSQQDRAIHQI